MSLRGGSSGSSTSQQQLDGLASNGPEFSLPVQGPCARVTFPDRDYVAHCARAHPVPPPSS
eukprot:101182-Pyramimonas_sp.AAC.1